MIDLRLGDCLEVMKDVPDSSIDLILCDLPYGTTSCSWDVVIPFEPLWAEYKRLTKDYGAIVLFSTQPFTTSLINSNFQMFKYTWVWSKSRPGGVFNAKNMPLKKHEDIVVFSAGTAANKSDKRMTYYPQGLIRTDKVVNNAKRKTDSTIGNRPSRTGSYKQEFTNYPGSVLTYNSETKTTHPTQKPVELLEYLIRTYSLEGDVVMDNCMGSGSTGVACVNTNRSFIGIEKDHTYFEIARKRLFDDRF